MSSENGNDLGTFKFYIKSVERTRSMNFKYCVKCSHIMIYNVIFSRRITERPKLRPEVVWKMRNALLARAALADFQPKLLRMFRQIFMLVFLFSIVSQRKGITVIFVVKNAAGKRKWSHKAVGFTLPAYRDSFNQPRLSSRMKKERN